LAKPSIKNALICFINQFKIHCLAKTSA